MAITEQGIHTAFNLAGVPGGIPSPATLTVLTYPDNGLALLELFSQSAINMIAMGLEDNAADTYILAIRIIGACLDAGITTTGRPMALTSATIGSINTSFVDAEEYTRQCHRRITGLGNKAQEAGRQIPVLPPAGITAAEARRLISLAINTGESAGIRATDASVAIMLNTDFVTVPGTSHYIPGLEAKNTLCLDWRITSWDAELDKAKYRVIATGDNGQPIIIVGPWDFRRWVTWGTLWTVPVSDGYTIEVQVAATEPTETNIRTLFKSYVLQPDPFTDVGTLVPPGGANGQVLGYMDGPAWQDAAGLADGSITLAKLADAVARRLVPENGAAGQFLGPDGWSVPVVPAILAQRGRSNAFSRNGNGYDTEVALADIDNIIYINISVDTNYRYSATIPKALVEALSAVWLANTAPLSPARSIPIASDGRNTWYIGKAGLGRIMLGADDAASWGWNIVG